MFNSCSQLLLIFSTLCIVYTIQVHVNVNCIHVFVLSNKKKVLLLRTICLQGWTLVVSCDMNHLYCSLPAEEQERVNGLELFDEYEEWHDKCSHYMLLYAMKGTCERLLPLLPQQNHVATLPSTSVLLNTINVHITEDPCIFKR